MAQTFEEFFPAAAQDTWKFIERSSGAAVTVDYRATAAAAGTDIDLKLSGLPSHVNPAFFDQLGLSRAGLELRRIRIGTQAFGVGNLLITLDPKEANRVPVFLPEGPVAVLNDRPPFAGKVASKKLMRIKDGLKQFTVRVVSTAQGGEQVFRVTLQFQTGRGLTDYRGDMGGIFFVYERQG